MIFPENHKANQIFVFGLFLLLAMYMFNNLWSGSLISCDEGVYGEIAREIIVGKKGWLTFHFNYQPWFEKPPLYIWLIALAYKLFGINEFSVRIWSALFGFGCVILLYFFSKKLFLSSRIALFSSLSLIGFTGFIKFSKWGFMDAPLTFFILLGLFLFWIGRRKAHYLLYIGILTGVAFMVKNFAAFLLPIIVIVFALVNEELKQLMNKKLFFGFLIGFLICLPWHIYEYIIWGNTFINEYFLKHVLMRTFQTFNENPESTLFYFKRLFDQNIPLGIISFFTIPYIVYSLHLEKDRERKSAFILIVTSVAVTFILFSFVKTKYYQYIMPAYPFLSLSIAVTADRIISKWRSDNRKPTIALLLILIMIPIGRYILDEHKTLDYSPEIKSLALSAKSNSNEQEVIFLYQFPRLETSDILFYSERKIIFVDRDELFERASDSKPFLCLMSKKNGFFEKLKIKKYGLTILRQTDKYILYKRYL